MFRVFFIILFFIQFTSATINIKENYYKDYNKTYKDDSGYCFLNVDISHNNNKYRFIEDTFFDFTNIRQCHYSHINKSDLYIFNGLEVYFDNKSYNNRDIYVYPLKHGLCPEVGSNKFIEMLTINNTILAYKKEIAELLLLRYNGKPDIQAEKALKQKLKELIK
ncbi:hypothetical protein OFO07_03425 [Campylobacter sp. JMF_06 NA1]|uniref:hypothetical protein n=1 Tax=Campylobacter sp. JMF_06 NA1 TaxID=2983823 RepID=UPI0022E9C84D|nr:hypothetical protein [Campylobacter sp. JMF_06 NA1]MDA3077975.1 hypothetical protein [Campylobacter sp. JMF_06 NA1]